MKERQLVLIRALLALALLAPTVACSRSSPQSETRELSLGAGERGSYAIELTRGDVLRIRASVVGDQTVDIGVWLEDPEGTPVVPEKRGRTVALSYGATASGRHHVIVNNAYSLFTGKVVSLTVTVER